MTGTDRQTAAGKVLWHFTMSLDGFVAEPNHGMDWMTGVSFCPPSTSATARWQPDRSTSTASPTKPAPGSTPPAAARRPKSQCR
jgi:hypothetical protein